MVMVGGVWVVIVSWQIVMIMYFWIVYVIILKGSFDGNGMLLILLQVSDYWYSGYLFDFFYFGNLCRIFDCVLLYLILFG